MSMDNYVAIIEQPDGTFRGYTGFASNDVSDEQLQENTPNFCAAGVREAIEMAQEIETEYGYYFVWRCRTRLI